MNGDKSCGCFAPAFSKACSNERGFKNVHRTDAGFPMTVSVHVSGSQGTYSQAQGVQTVRIESLYSGKVRIFASAKNLDIGTVSVIIL